MGSKVSTAGPVIKEGLGYVMNDHNEMKTMISHGVHLAAFLHSCHGGKDFNQDSVVFCQGYDSENGVLCGVFDGHGIDGHKVSKFVSQGLPLLLLNHKNGVTNTKKKCDENSNKNQVTKNGCQSSKQNILAWQDACLNAFEEMDEQIKFLRRADVSASGTTAVVVIKQGEDLIIANLGDSRAVLGMKTENGVRAVQITTDLKPSLPGEAERIRRSNGRVYAKKGETLRMWLPHGSGSPGIAMSRCFGDFDLKNYGLTSTPVVTHHNLAADDLFVVLATDGVWDALSNEEVVSIVCRTDKKERAAKAVVDAAIATWKRSVSWSEVDDCSAVCLFLQ